MKPGSDVDGGWAWVVLGASYLNILLCSGIGYISGVYQVVFLEQFKGSVALTAWVTSLFSSLMQMGGPLSSLVSNWFGCQVACIVGGAFMATGLFGASLADTLPSLFVFFGVVAGTGLGLIYSASIVVISFYFHRRRTLVNGLVSAAGGLGIFLAPQLAQVLMAHYNWRETLVFLAGMSAQMCVAGALMFSLHEKRRMCDLIGRYSDTELTSLRDDQDQILVAKDTVDGCKREENGKSILQRTDVDRFLSLRNIEGDDLSICAKTDLLDVEDGDKNEKEYCIVDPSCSQSKKCDCHQHPMNSDRSDNVTWETKTGEIGLLFEQKHGHAKEDNNCGDRLSSSSNKHDDAGSNALLKDNEKSGNIIDDLGQSSQCLSSHHSHSDSHLEVLSNLPASPFLGSTLSIKTFASNSSIHIFQNGEFRKNVNERDSQIINTNRSQLTDEANFAPKYPKLYANELFLVLCACLFVSNAGCGIFNIHVASFLKSQGLSEQDVTNVLSINGLAILFGRSLLGAMTNSIPGSDVLFFMVMQIVGGFIMCLMPLLGTTALANNILIAGIGAYAGTSYALLPTLTIRYVGLNGLATAFGIEMVSAGLAYLIAPPIAGVLVDMTGSYHISMLSGGGLLIVGGLMTMFLPGMEKCVSMKRTHLRKSQDL